MADAFVVELADVGPVDRERVGGKAAGLGELLRAGLPVPAGFCVTTAAYSRFAAQHELVDVLPAIDLADADPSNLDSALEHLRSALLATPIPLDVDDAVRQAHLSLGNEPLAVRSSATLEDLAQASFAGQQDTCLNVVGPDALLDAVRRPEATLAPEAILPTLVQTVAQALKLPYAAIVLNRPDSPARVAVHCSAASEMLVLPLVYQGEPLGEFRVGARTQGESFSPADHHLFEDVAHQAGIAAHAVRLTADLQRSRERLVATREEERRRLRPDLHDGLGSALASLALELDAARNLVDRDPMQTKTLLDELKRQTQASIVDIGRLLNDLRPPALDELRLVSAIREHAVRAAEGADLQVVVHAQAIVRGREAGLGQRGT